MSSDPLVYGLDIRFIRSSGAFPVPFSCLAYSEIVLVRAGTCSAGIELRFRFPSALLMVRMWAALITVCCLMARTSNSGPDSSDNECVDAICWATAILIELRIRIADNHRF